MNAQHCIQTRYRREIWSVFTDTVKTYRLLPAGCRVAVPVGNTAQSALCALLLHMLERWSRIPITVCAFPTDESGLAQRLDLPLVMQTPSRDVFAAASELGCERVADSACFSDAVEGLLSGMLRKGVLRGLPPLETREKLTVIRPLYQIPRQRAESWARASSLDLLSAPADTEIQALLAALRRENPNAEISIFRSLQNVWPDTMPPQEP